MGYYFVRFDLYNVVYFNKSKMGHGEEGGAFRGVAV